MDSFDCFSNQIINYLSYSCDPRKKDDDGLVNYYCFDTRRIAVFIIQYLQCTINRLGQGR